MKKQKFRKFAEGGNDDLEDFENKVIKKPAKKSEDLEDFESKALPGYRSSAAQESAVPPGGRFDPDTYARARQAVAERTARASANTATSTAATGSGRGGQGGPTAAELTAYQNRIGGGARSTGQGGATAEDIAEHERRRRLMTPGADAIEGVYPEQYIGAGAVGIGAKAAANAAKTLAQYPVKTLATAGKEGVEAAMKYGPKAGMEVAESTAKGALSRAAIQAKRAAGKKAEAEAMEAAKPILKARPGKTPLRNKTRFDEDMAGTEFRKGGKAFAKGGHVSSASSRADGIAQRGKTRGTIVACGGGYMKGKK